MLDPFVSGADLERGGRRNCGESARANPPPPPPPTHTHTPSSGPHHHRNEKFTFMDFLLYNDLLHNPIRIYKTELGRLPPCPPPLPPTESEPWVAQRRVCDCREKDTKRFSCFVMFSVTSLICFFCLGKERDIS